MKSNPSPRVANFLPASIFLFIIGWGGLIALIISSLPTVGPRWLFYFLTVLAPPTALLSPHFKSLFSSTSPTYFVVADKRSGLPFTYPP
jgi:hypothetical protein